MLNSSLYHNHLKTDFRGVNINSHGVVVQQYRGIKYGVIPGRFELAQPTAVSDTEQAVDATKFGYGSFSVYTILTHRTGN
jgi:hypothetical protein